MKKIFAFVLILSLAFASCASSEGESEYDLDTMSADELYALIDAARLRLMEFDGTYAEPDMVLYDEQGVKVAVADWNVRSFGKDDATLDMNIIIENDTDAAIIVFAKNPRLNGWALSDVSSSSIESGARARKKFSFDYVGSKADVMSNDDLQDIQFALTVTGVDYKTLASTDVRLQFGNHE
ncbi:MAG: hypothetical protein PHS57_06075 [Alphaproteobacteria bacterium]|nr:hypothetical protein [Alphaproteobacteria bacterium]